MGKKPKRGSYVGFDTPQRATLPRGFDGFDTQATQPKPQATQPKGFFYESPFLDSTSPISCLEKSRMIFMRTCVSVIRFILAYDNKHLCKSSSNLKLIFDFSMADIILHYLAIVKEKMQDYARNIVINTAFIPS